MYVDEWEPKPGCFRAAFRGVCKHAGLSRNAGADNGVWVAGLFNEDHRMPWPDGGNLVYKNPSLVVKQEYV